MKRVENISEKELNKIKRLIGSAFVTNELFREFGSPDERRTLVLKYMSAYVDYVYESKSLFSSDDGIGFICLQYSENAPVFPQIKLLCRLFVRIPFTKGNTAKQIANGNKHYASKPHIDILMVAVDKNAQGKGYATKLVSFAKQMAKRQNVPLPADTDMKNYAEMYKHLGFELYNTKTASNGVTRHNLVWKPFADI